MTSPGSRPDGLGVGGCQWPLVAGGARTPAVACGLPLACEGTAGDDGDWCVERRWCTVYPERGSWLNSVKGGLVWVWYGLVLESFRCQVVPQYDSPS